jgi:hypothetical protein
MARFRCEAIEDLKSGKFYVELYYPHEATEPIAVTQPIYHSLDEAEEKTVELFREWFNQIK